MNTYDWARQRARILLSSNGPTALSTCPERLHYPIKARARCKLPDTARNPEIPGPVPALVTGSADEGERRMIQSRVGNWGRRCLEWSRRKKNRRVRVFEEHLFHFFRFFSFFASWRLHVRLLASFFWQQVFADARVAFLNLSCFLMARITVELRTLAFFIESNFLTHFSMTHSFTKVRFLGAWL